MSNSGVNSILLLAVSFVMIAIAAGAIMEVSTDISDNIRSSGESTQQDIGQDFVLTTEQDKIFDKTSNRIKFAIRNEGLSNYNLESLNIQVLINGDSVDADIATQSGNNKWNTRSSAQFTVDNTTVLSDNSENSLVVIISGSEVKSRFFSNVSIEIEDWNDVNKDMRNNPDQSFILTQNIDKNTNGYQSVVQNSGFTPIDNFGGNLYGQGNTISDLSVTSDQDTVGGLFNTTSGKVLNLVINSSDVSSGSSGVSEYGILTGRITQDGLVRNVHIGDNSVVDSSNKVGGISGLNKGTIIQSSFQGSHSIGDQKVGGIAGVNVGIIKDSYTISEVFGSDDTGGLVGFDDSTKAVSVEESYVVADITNPTGDFSNGNFGNVAGRVSSSSGSGIYFDQDRNPGLLAAVGSGSYGDTTGLQETEMKGTSAVSNMGDLNFVVLWDTVSSGSDDYPTLSSISKSRQLNLR